MAENGGGVLGGGLWSLSLGLEFGEVLAGDDEALDLSRAFVDLQQQQQNGTKKGDFGAICKRVQAENLGLV